MPVHDWTRVDAGLFHSFHQGWISALCAALNAGGLPPDYFALAEQAIQGPIPDVLTLEISPGSEPSPAAEGGLALAVATAPPRARVVRVAEVGAYARRADRVTVRHRHGRVVAVIEIVSPGNKAAASELRAFVQKVSGLIRRGVHALIVDLFPPTQRDPFGIHKAIWDEFEEQEFLLPPGKPLTLAAYAAGAAVTAYVEPIAPGDDLPDMPLFLEPESYVLTPLEATYRSAWDAFPATLKGLLAPRGD
jgi:hypothetical protein